MSVPNTRPQRLHFSGPIFPKPLQVKHSRQSPLPAASRSDADSALPPQVPWPVD